MVIKNGRDIPSHEVTDERSYFSRRTFLQAASLVGAVAATAGVYSYFTRRRIAIMPTQPLEKLEVLGPQTAPTPAGASTLPASHELTLAQRMAAGFYTDEPKTPFEDIASYNNFYEFSTSKTRVAELAKGFVSRPWQVRVEGLVSKPRTFDLDDLLKIGLEERVYRHRCVEGWSMVIPWLGFPLASLLNLVQPLSDAKYVHFVTLLDEKRMPNQASDDLPWPYEEGLRMDEAMNPLAILSMGLYGKTLPPQNGAPVRLVVPWKYGFKGIKSIVKIELVKEQPKATWNVANAHEYGFYSNVNPNVDHPRWSQATERRLPDSSPRATLMFNGYAQQVAHLYAGMDLVANY